MYLNEPTACRRGNIRRGSLSGDFFFEFLRPPRDDLDLARRRRIRPLVRQDAENPLAVKGEIVGPARPGDSPFRLENDTGPAEPRWIPGGYRDRDELMRHGRVGRIYREVELTSGGPPYGVDRRLGRDQLPAAGTGEASDIHLEPARTGVKGAGRPPSSGWGKAGGFSLQGRLHPGAGLPLIPFIFQEAEFSHGILVHEGSPITGPG